MQRHEPPPTRSLFSRFKSAFRGTKIGIRREGNFFIHFFLTTAVIIAAAVLRAAVWEWAILLLCVGVVLMAEMFNTALEAIAKAVTDEHNVHLRDGLDISSAAVLVAATSASIVGLLVFIHRLGGLLDWWVP